MRKPARGWLVIVAMALIVACPASQQLTAYKTLGAVVNVVYTGMQVYGSEVQAGHISADNQAKVKKAYELYQLAIGPAIKTRGLTAPVSDDVAVAANALLSILKEIGVMP
jgi:hypothetical protein